MCFPKTQVGIFKGSWCFHRLPHGKGDYEGKEASVESHTNKTRVILTEKKPVWEVLGTGGSRTPTRRVSVCKLSVHTASGKLSLNFITGLKSRQATGRTGDMRMSFVPLVTKVVQQNLEMLLLATMTPVK